MKSSPNINLKALMRFVENERNPYKETNVTWLGSFSVSKAFKEFLSMPPNLARTTLGVHHATGMFFQLGRIIEKKACDKEIMLLGQQFNSPYFPKKLRESIVSTQEAEIVLGADFFEKLLSVKPIEQPPAPPANPKFLFDIELLEIVLGKIKLPTEIINLFSSDSEEEHKRIYSKVAEHSSLTEDVLAAKMFAALIFNPNDHDVSEEALNFMVSKGDSLSKMLDMNYQDIATATRLICSWGDQSKKPEPFSNINRNKFFELLLSFQSRFNAGEQLYMLKGKDCDYCYAIVRRLAKKATSTLTLILDGELCRTFEQISGGIYNIFNAHENTTKKEAKEIINNYKAVVMSESQNPHHLKYLIHLMFGENVPVQVFMDALGNDAPEFLNDWAMNQFIRNPVDEHPPTFDLEKALLTRDITDIANTAVERIQSSSNRLNDGEPPHRDLLNPLTIRILLKAIIENGNYALLDELNKSIANTSDPAVQMARIRKACHRENLVFFSQLIIDPPCLSTGAINPIRPTEQLVIDTLDTIRCKHLLSDGGEYGNPKCSFKLKHDLQLRVNGNSDISLVLPKDLMGVKNGNLVREPYAYRSHGLVQLNTATGGSEYYGEMVLLSSDYHHALAYLFNFGRYDILMKEAAYVHGRLGASLVSPILDEMICSSFILANDKQYEEFMSLSESGLTSAFKYLLTRKDWSLPLRRTNRASRYSDEPYFLTDTIINLIQEKVVKAVESYPFEDDKFVKLVAKSISSIDSEFPSGKCKNGSELSLLFSSLAGGNNYGLDAEFTNLSTYTDSVVHDDYYFITKSTDILFSFAYGLIRDSSTLSESYFDYTLHPLLLSVIAQSMSEGKAYGDEIPFAVKTRQNTARSLQEISGSPSDDFLLGLHERFMKCISRYALPNMNSAQKVALLNYFYEIKMNAFHGDHYYYEGTHAIYDNDTIYVYSIHNWEAFIEEAIGVEEKTGIKPTKIILVNANPHGYNVDGLIIPLEKKHDLKWLQAAAKALR
ncbi:hypothetical protein KW882_00595 [Vibrio parahaemolyticus]